MKKVFLVVLSMSLCGIILAQDSICPSDKSNNQTYTNGECKPSYYQSAVLWYKDPDAAFMVAVKEKKPVLMLHLSGLFDDPAKT